jgi:ABC-type uncharacterized transport system YnjBCD substrate-binding protein
MVRVKSSSAFNDRTTSKSNSDIDLMWINGETFYQLKQINGLYGPWTDKLPNAKNIDFKILSLVPISSSKSTAFELPKTFRWHGFIIAIKLKSTSKEGNCL